MHKEVRRRVSADDNAGHLILEAAVHNENVEILLDEGALCLGKARVKVGLLTELFTKFAS